MNCLWNVATYFTQFTHQHQTTALKSTVTALKLGTTGTYITRVAQLFDLHHYECY